ncbi:MAG: AmmeMemoRadiSam system radical SAM enzyme [Planctomycetota bacterium]
MVEKDINLKEAVLWEALEGKKVQCFLCNHRCLIAEGKVGFCRVRKNIDGTLYSLNYNIIVAANPDPIEKKPLFHFQPGSRSFSIAAPGCNFRCQFCQNWQISQVDLATERIGVQRSEPESIVEAAKRNNCKSIAYTYTEPTVFMELAEDCARIAKQNGLMNVFVSNGYMTIEAVEFAKEWLDAINVDLKAFTEDYYKKLCRSRLSPVRETIRHIAKQTGIWLEITTLLVPGQNDSDEELTKLAEFIVEAAGPGVPWHVSRFYPNYKYLDSAATSAATLERAMEIGKKAGLWYVYVGNLPGSKAESTFCHSCDELLIERVGYRIIVNRVKNSKCPKCGVTVRGIQM